MSTKYEKQQAYKILQLYAKDIYANTRFDEYGNNGNLAYSISSIKDNDLSSLFRGSVNKSLDLLELFNKYGEDNIVKSVGDTKYLTAFVSVVFKGKSSEFTSRIDFSDNKLVYIRRGFNNYGEVFENLEDSVYIKDNVIIAVKVDNIIQNENINVTNLKHFKIEEKDGQKYYAYTNSSIGNIKSIKLREELYKDGFSLNIDGKIIKYRRYKRSASNARVGNCLFINEEYYNHMNSWTYLDMKAFEFDPIVENKPVEIEAYKALSLSSLKNTIELNPHNILILKDEYSIFNEECINVRLDERGSLKALKEKTSIKNNIWDGEGLLDVSEFEKNGYSDKGMLLLRNKYLKCCAFNTNLQQWFKDNNITSISELNGFTLAKDIHDIKLVVTESSMKILKFSDSEKIEDPIKKLKIDEIVDEIWMDRTGTTFGVVKTDEPPHRFSGRVVSTSYQVLNTLGMDKEEVKELIKPSHNYLLEIKNNAAVLRYYLDNEIDIKDDNSFENENTDEIECDDTFEELSLEDTSEDIFSKFSSYRYKICSELLRINPKFENTKLYSNFRTELLANIKKNYKRGKILIPGTFATIFGNGYELLLATIHKFDINSTKPILGSGEVMCKRFTFNKEICAARYPHITMGNLYLAKNVEREEYNTYFNLSNEIVCINAIGENIQQKLNGMDYDSDTMLITDFKPIVDITKKNYDKFLVPVCSIDSQKILKQPLYIIDNKVANNYIGRIVNLSQHLNSILWDIYHKENRIDEEVYLEICKLAILSGIEIDKAKRDYNVDSLKEFNKINNWVKESKYKDIPNFIEKKNNKKYETQKKSMDYETLMDYLCFEDFDTGGRKNNKVKLSNLLIKITSSNTKVYAEKAKEIEQLLVATYKNINTIETKYNMKNVDSENKREIIYQKNMEIKKQLDDFYKSSLKLIKHPYTIKLFLNMNAKETHLWPLLYVLYNTKPTGKNTSQYNNLLEELFASNQLPKRLFEDENGSIELFGKKYITK